MSSHRFRPRFRALAWLALFAGVALSIAGLALPLGETMRTGALAGGVIGVLLGAGYLASPTWRYQVIADDAGLSVRAGARLRWNLPWTEVTEVIAAPEHHTCFVNGGSPERSLLVPGIDAPASYDLTDKDTLYARIVSSVPADRVREVSSLVAEA